MAHFPVNHPARPLYRVLAGLIGLYILVFGVYGRRPHLGQGLFGRGSDWVARPADQPGLLAGLGASSARS